MLQYRRIEVHAASQWNTVLVHWYRLINAPLEEEPLLHAPRNGPVSGLPSRALLAEMFVEDVRHSAAGEVPERI